MKVELLQKALEFGLNEAEYGRILEILGREPNEVELGIFSVMWSEHCSYKSSRIHLKKLPTSGARVVQGPGENAGVVDIGEGWGLAFKMESHNHPSFIEPYQGAATGVGGILRDVFTMGARPIANLNSLRFGAHDHPKTPFLLHGVVAGIAAYGNCMGIPTVGGEVFFDASYNGNILVNAMTVGLVRNDKIFKGLAQGVGNPVMYVGSKTGRDGIHGATMASGEFDESSEEKRPTVQVGDPFTEKLLLEACLEVMATDLLVGIQDMGAAGLTSSSFEMASRAGSGIEMDLDQIPVREEGMSAYEMMLSESQERMLLVAKRGCEDKVVEIFQKWDLDAVVVGRVTEDGWMRLKKDGSIVAELPIQPLTDAAPCYDRPQQPVDLSRRQAFDADSLAWSSDWNGILLRMLGAPNLCCRRWVYRQYDHMVMTNTVVLPGSDAAVLRIKGLKKGVAITTDCNSRYCYLDPYWGAQHAVAEAARNLACSGAQPLAVTDCLNFGNPEKPDVMWEFAEAVRGMGEACRILETPIVSGNVSLYNDTNGVSIFPTPTIGMVGLLEDVDRHVTAAFKKPGDAVFLLGELLGSLGGSEYLSWIHGKSAGAPPPLDWEQERALQTFLLQAAASGLISSAHDVSDGGLVVALAESCLSGPVTLGLEASLPPFPASPKLEAELLFGEGAGRAVLSTAAEKAASFEELALAAGLKVTRLGVVGEGIFKLEPYFDLPIVRLKEAWDKGLEKIVKREA
ncbi:MAG TPA: phosphoribosylformylglycinamidine synthase subunit PurL [Deltaproteobacteria bacterium]|nr:phosphoribosylformylglycinamidine synthase subunit PurL [Deltaproteobacteria bacterium]